MKSKSYSRSCSATAGLALESHPQGHPRGVRDCRLANDRSRAAQRVVATTAVAPRRSSPLYVLGVNVAENPSACLIAGDGRTIATSEQQQDGDPVGDPDRSARPHVLPRAGARGRGLPRQRRRRARRSRLVVLCGEVVHAPRAQPRNLSVADCMLQLPWSPRSRILTIDHHLAHACSAFYPSGFDHASILVVDRGGCVAPQPRRGLGPGPPASRSARRGCGPRPIARTAGRRSGCSPSRIAMTFPAAT